VNPIQRAALGAAALAGAVIAANVLIRGTTPHVTSGTFSDEAAQAAREKDAKDELAAEQRAEAAERAQQAATAAAIEKHRKARCQITMANGRAYNCP